VAVRVSLHLASTLGDVYWFIWLAAEFANRPNPLRWLSRTTNISRLKQRLWLEPDTQLCTGNYLHLFDQ
jgi:hypothetical protein